MSVSQNGWTVDQSGSKQTRAGVDGVTFPNGILAGDVATVLLYVADRFHREVEPLKKGSCWGWFVKPIEGSKTVSNHASGTAIDLNADTHPMGVRGTFTAPKRAKIHAILANCDGVVRWGGDYTGRPDDMHFEIDKNAAAVKALAAKIRNEGNDMAAITQADFDARMDAWWLARMSPTAADNKIRAALRIAPWQQLVGKTGKSTHEVLFGDMLAMLQSAAGDDAAAIIAGVLAGLNPQEIADAVAAAMPADEAQKVADELAARLAA